MTHGASLGVSLVAQRLVDQACVGRSRYGECCADYGEGIVAGGNSALRALLDEAGMSNAGLARAVARAGAAEGIHLGTNATSVGRMLDGCQPRWPVPRVVAKVLSQHLGFAVSVTDCGFADRDEVADTFDAFRRAPTADGTIATVVELSGRDIKRRNFLLGASFAAASFAEPAWLAMTMPTAQAEAGNRRVGAAEVSVITDTVRHFERLQRRIGGGKIRDPSSVSSIGRPSWCGAAAIRIT